MPERFPASIKWSHADELEALCNRISSAPKYTVTASDAVFLGNLAGALNYARQAYVPPAVVVDFGVAGPDTTGTGKWRACSAGVIFAITAPTAGRVSAAVDDGASLIEISTDIQFPADGIQRGISASAAGGIDLRVPAGRVYGRHFGDYGGRVFQVRWDWSPD